MNVKYLIYVERMQNVKIFLAVMNASVMMDTDCKMAANIFMQMGTLPCAKV